MTRNTEIENKRTGKRIQYVDCAKGIAIILVIFGHVVEWIYPNNLGNIFHNIIYSFHMPLFFVLSGLTYSDEKNKCFKQFVVKKIKTLMIPSYVFVVIMLLLEYILGLYNFSFSTTKLLKTVLQFRMDSLRNYWFLPTLFWAFIIIWCIHRLYIKNIYRMGILTVVSILGAVYITYIKKPLPFSFDNALLLSVFIELGCQLKLILDKCKKIQMKYIITMFFIWIIFTILNSYVIGDGAIYLAQSSIQNPILFYLAAISGSLLCIFICFNTHKIGIFSKIGRHTLIIYILQGTIVWNISLFINKYDCTNIFMCILVWMLIIIFTVLVSYYVSIFINKKASFLIGKNK